MIWREPGWRNAQDYKDMTIPASIPKYFIIQFNPPPKQCDMSDKVCMACPARLSARQLMFRAVIKVLNVRTSTIHDILLPILRRTKNRFP